MREHNTKDVAVLREVVTKVTEMLVGKGLKVTQQGAQAFVQGDKTGKPIRINIPYLSDDAPMELILAIHGFIDHEVGHVLFTNYGTMAKTFKNGTQGPRVSVDDQRLANMSNIIEDPMVERLISDRFPGAQYNLGLTHEFFLQKVTEPALKKAKETGNEEMEFGYIMVPMIRALSGPKQRVYHEWMTKNDYWNHRLIKGLLDAAPKALIDSLQTLKTTQDCIEAARAFNLILHPPVPAAPPAPQPPAPKAPPAPPKEPSKSEEKSDDEDGEGSNTNKPEDKDDRGSKGEKPEDQGESEKRPEPAESSDDESDGKGESPSDAGEEKGKDKKPKKEKEKKPSEKSDDESEPAGDDQGAEPDDAAGDDEGSDSEADDADAEDGDNQNGEASDEEGEDGSPTGGETDDDEGEGSGDAGDSGDETGDDEGAKPGKEGANSGSDGAGDEGDDELHAVEASEIEGDGEHGAGSSSSIFVGVELPEFAEFNEGVSGKITALATTSTVASDYRVFTRDQDRIETYVVDEHRYKDHALVTLENTVSHMIGGMQKDIERMMAARSQVMNVPGFRSGRLHGAGLHRLMAGDDRIFRRKHEAKSTDTAVSLLIDNSGSMSGEKMTLAMQAGYALSSTLERVRIAHEAIGFTTSHDVTREYFEELEREATRIGKGFSRNVPLYMPIFKSFDERLNPQIRKRFAAAIHNQNYLMNNIDGESVRIAAHRLMKRKETRKVMIVLSDGNPAASTRYHKEIEADLHRAVRECEQSKIDIIGIGINSNAVKAYYKKNVVLNDITKLPTEIMGQLKAILAA